MTFSNARRSVADFLVNDRLLAVAAQVFHWAAILPLAYLVVSWYRGRFNSLPYRLMAWGFAVSFAANLVRLLLPADVGWVVSHFYPAAQLGLFALALGAIEVPAVLLVLMVLLSAWLPMDKPDVVLKVAGSVAILAVIPQSEFGLVLVVYCGYGAFLWFLMTGAIPDPPARTPEFMGWYYGYQLAQLAGISLFLRQSIRLHRLEV